MPSRTMPGHNERTLLRWLFGIVLVTWRYMWSTIPLHRTEEMGDSGDLPPPLDGNLIDERNQQLEDGVGLLWHRCFTVDIEGSPLTARQLITAVANNLNLAAPTETAVFTKTRGATVGLTVGDEYVVRMPGPWDGPVRVVRRTDTSFQLATLRGHLEAGQVEFRAECDDGALRFTVETWNRAGTPLVDFLYSGLRLAKEIQCNMWVRYCQGAAAAAAGRICHGLTVRTRWISVPVLR